MKSGILAVLMIYLSVMPCDDLNEVDSCAIDTNFHTQNDQDPDGHSESDDCSPFCVCQCCHTPVIMSSYFVRTSIAVYSTADKMDYYQSVYPNGINDAIWHPPKLA